jgi:hypothetical protein
MYQLINVLAGSLEELHTLTCEVHWASQMLHVFAPLGQEVSVSVLPSSQLSEPFLTPSPQ